MKTFQSFAVLLSAFALASCEKNAVQDITGSLPEAQIRFFNFGVNAPGVNFFANENKLTALLSGTGVESTTGTVYGGAGSAGFYSALTPGTYSFSGKIAAATDKDLTISTISSALVAGKAYSLYLSGLYDATGKKSDGFVVEDNFANTYDYSVAYVRFVNAISNSQPMTLFVRDTTVTPATEVPIGAAVAYKAGGTFVAVPVGVYNLSTRVTGSAANVISRSAVSFGAGKVYTVGARGDMTITSTTAVTRPFLDNTANR